jgi:hypothetical protein
MIISKYPFTDLDLHTLILCDICQDFINSILKRDKLKQEQDFNERANNELSSS